MPIFWEAVCILETTCNPWVIAAASDSASPNRCFYHLQSFWWEWWERCMLSDSQFICTSSIHLLLVTPLLVKTSKKCLKSSGSGTCSPGAECFCRSVLKAFGLSEASAKAKLCEMVDGFCAKFMFFIVKLKRILTYNQINNDWFNEPFEVSQD